MVRPLGRQAEAVEPGREHVGSDRSLHACTSQAGVARCQPKKNKNK